MFTHLAYFIVLLAACSCETVTPTDTAKSSKVSGTFFRYYEKTLENFKDFPLKNGVNILKEDSFNKSGDTMIYVESWQQNTESEAAQEIMKAYGQISGVNIMVFDWSSINNGSYVSVAAKVEEVGTALGKQLCKMVSAGLSSRYTDLIGLSLGAHLAGQAGSTMQKSCSRTIGRVVALDAARSLFYFPLPIYRSMDKDDALLTIAIHTSGLQYGVFQRIAKADFYVNGGRPIQPGCGLKSLFNECNRNRSWQLFADSVYNRRTFRAARADSYLDFSQQTCKENAKHFILMGDGTHVKLRGSFYLTTNGKSPYGKGVEGLCI